MKKLFFVMALALCIGFAGPAQAETAYFERSDQSYEVTIPYHAEYVQNIADVPGLDCLVTASRGYAYSVTSNCNWTKYCNLYPTDCAVTTGGSDDDAFKPPGRPFGSEIKN